MITALESPLRKYSHLGILKAGELLLRPTNAIDVINDLEQLGILILGVDLWYGQEPDLAEEPNSLDLSDINDVIQNADSAREFIAHHLPARTTWVSLVCFEESTPATKTKLLKLLSMLQQFGDQDINQFLRILDALPQKDEEFIDLLLEIPRGEDQRKLIQVFSSILSGKPEIDANLLPSQPRPNTNIKLVCSNGVRVQDSFPQSKQNYSSRTENKENLAAPRKVA